jgi:hypothetical protein
MALRLLIAFCLLAWSLFAAATTSAGATGGGPSRPQPPTSEEVDRATERFLDSMEDGRGGPEAAGGTGGIGDPSQPTDDSLFPDSRVIAFYGAPQMGATIIGRKSISAAKRRLRKQARPYEGRGRRVFPGIDLVAVLATADRGSDGKYRTRQPDRIVEAYLEAARELNGRLILDIQPGRSSVMKEVRALKEWLVRPNVDVALDPEWNVGRNGRPGRSVGSVRAKTVNRVTGYMSDLIAEKNLPPKTFVIHQFRGGSIKKERRIVQPAGVDVTLNFDGIGGKAAKRTGYKRLSRDNLFAGFSLFYRLDKGLMSPSKVLKLKPSPDFVLYQ